MTEITEKQKRECWKINIKHWSEDELINYLIGQDNAIEGLRNNLNAWKESALKDLFKKTDK